MNLPNLPPGLATWGVVVIFVIIVIGLVLIAYFTGNHKKRSKIIKNISQSGNNNNQHFGDYIGKKEEDS